MKTSSTRIQQSIATLAAVCTLIGAVNSSLLAQTDNSGHPQRLVNDIALQADGVLRGRLTDRSGNPLGQREVQIRERGVAAMRAISNRHGEFVFSGVQPGLHQITTDDDLAICRLWAENTAPPSARDEVLLSGGSVVRGQCGCRWWRRCQSCCNTYDGGGGYDGGYTQGYAAPVPEPPTMSMEQLRELAPDLPDEQFAAVTRASVVVINPDHYSVVIEFNSANGTATLVGKAIDEAALQIQSVARGGGVPVVRNPSLARAIYDSVAVGGGIPEPLLGQIAAVMAELAAAAPAIQPGGFEGGGFEGGGVDVGPGPLANPRVLIAGGIIAAGVAIPVAVANEDDEEDTHGS